MYASQLRSMERKLQFMSNSLGGQQLKNLSVPKDQFQRARLNFKNTLKQYEARKEKLNISNDRLEHITLASEMTDFKKTLQKQLKWMIQHIDKKNKQTKKKPTKQIEDQLKYKKLQCLNCQKAYCLLVQTIQSRDPKPITLQQLIKNRQDQQQPLINQKQQDDEDRFDDELVLRTLKEIDDLIEDKMDQILQNIEKLKTHALSISEALDMTHKQILLNLKVMEKNDETLNNANKKLKKFVIEQKRTSFWIKLIIVGLIVLVLYLVYKQFGNKVKSAV